MCGVSVSNVCCWTLDTPFIGNVGATLFAYEALIHTQTPDTILTHVDTGKKLKK